MPLYRGAQPTDPTPFSPLSISSLSLPDLSSKREAVLQEAVTLAHSIKGYLASVFIIPEEDLSQTEIDEKSNLLRDIRLFHLLLSQFIKIQDNVLHSNGSTNSGIETVSHPLEAIARELLSYCEIHLVMNKIIKNRSDTVTETDSEISVNSTIEENNLQIMAFNLKNLALVLDAFLDKVATH
jgi:hypothetical protein